MQTSLSSSVRDLLDELSRRGWEWFVRCTHPNTGMVLDRFANFADPAGPVIMSSIAATGFYLSLLPDAVRRGRLAASEAEARAETSLRFAERHIEHVEGVLPHFVDWSTGRRFGASEFSALDTAIFLNGGMVAAGAYPGLGGIVDRLLDRVRWPALVIQEGRRAGQLAYGFDGRTRDRLGASADVRSSENLMPCVLAAGSRTHRVDRRCWYSARIVRSPEAPDVLNPGHALFTSYYGLVWMDLSGLHDAEGVDLWSNARSAALLNRTCCRVHASKGHGTYRADNGSWWGLSAGDSPAGYVARGPLDGDPDGTVWPTAALGSIAWIPDELSADLAAWSGSAWWPRALGRYGLSPFSADRDWIGRDIIGIDIGAFMGVWANVQARAIHALWAGHPVARRGVTALEFSHP